MKLKTIVALLVLAGGCVHAQTVEVKDAWVRTAVLGQSGTGAFMTIATKEGATLVGALFGRRRCDRNPRNEDGRRRDAHAPRAGAGPARQQDGSAQAGGYHLMMMELKQALPKGATVPLTLTFKDAKGQESRVGLKLPVAASAPGASRAEKAGIQGGGNDSHKH